MDTQRMMEIQVCLDYKIFHDEWSKWALLDKNKNEGGRIVNFSFDIMFISS